MCCKRLFQRQECNHVVLRSEGERSWRMALTQSFSRTRPPRASQLPFAIASRLWIGSGRKTCWRIMSGDEFTIEALATGYKRSVQP